MMESSVARGAGHAQNPAANLAAVLAVAAFACWVVADFVDDALYAVNGLLALGALVTGVAAWRRARAGAPHGKRAIAATIVAALFVAANIGFGIAEIVG